MDEKLNHKCVVCGTRYHHCDDCNKMKTFTPWRTICDTAQHYQVYLIIKDYSSKNITKNRACECLNRIDVNEKNIKEYKDSIQAILKEIFNKPKVNKKLIKTTEPVDEE